METLAGSHVEHAVESFVFELATTQTLTGRQNLTFGRSKHAIEASKNRHRQHHPLVLWRTVRAAQQVGDLPDQVSEIVVVRHLFVLSPVP